MVRAPEPDQESEKHLHAGLEQAGAGAVKVDYNTSGALLSFDLLNAIRSGAIVSIQGDRTMAGVVNEVGPLFGRRVPLPSGPFSLALAAQVPIFPLFIVRSGYRRYRIVACAPIHVRRTQSARRDDLESGLRAWRRVLEKVVTDYPAQWFAFVPLLAADAKP
jgi:lauroyl/myristoyl acyltransferase